MADRLVQFFLIDHLTFTALMVGIPCVIFKWYVVTHCVSHPAYVGKR